LKKFIYSLVFLIPLINGLATSTTAYFPPGTLNPGTIRAFLVGAPLLVFIVRYYPMQRVNLLILGYTAYLFFLVLLSSDVLWSFYMYIKLAFGFLMFPLGYYFVRTIRAFKRLMLSFAVTLALLLLNILISNVFELGTSDYLDDSFYFGAGRVNITTSMLILVLVAPVTLPFFKGLNKKILIVLFIAGLLVALIGIKRSVLLTAVFAPIVYGLFTRYKKKLISSLLILASLLTLSVFIFPGYYSVFAERYSARKETGSLELTGQALSSQARFNEYNLVLETWVEGSLKHKLIGSEWLNDMYFFKSGRMLHTDYMVLLNGSGLIGFLWWFLILLVILRELHRHYLFLRRNDYYNSVYAVSICLMAAQLLMSISGTLYSIDVRSLLMLFWGAAVGIMRSGVNELMLQSSNTANNQATTD
jgi:hypothetical protein